MKTTEKESKKYEPTYWECPISTVERQINKERCIDELRSKIIDDINKLTELAKHTFNN